MAHPYNSQRDHKVQHSRVGTITKGYASGGGVHSDAKADAKMIKRMVKSTALKLHGGSVGSRSDKPQRAAGGMIPGGKKATKKGGNTVNVIISGLGSKPDMPKPMAPPMPPPMPPKPPMAGPPPGGPPMPPPGGPPPMRAKGGKVDASKGGTPVQSQNMKETELKNVGRKPVITK